MTPISVQAVSPKFVVAGYNLAQSALALERPHTEPKHSRLSGSSLDAALADYRWSQP